MQVRDELLKRIEDAKRLAEPLRSQTLLKLNQEIEQTREDLFQQRRAKVREISKTPEKERGKLWDAAFEIQANYINILHLKAL